MKDSDIDFSDIPELGPDFFANAILWQPKEERNKRESRSVPEKQQTQKGVRNAPVRKGGR
jgi:hypothetical protein